MTCLCPTNSELEADPLTFLFFRFDLLIFRERDREEEREEEKYQSAIFHMCPYLDQTHNWGMCPDQESNQQLFTLWVDTQPTKLHWSGLPELLLILQTQG